jgi:putative phosphoesterase
LAGSADRFQPERRRRFDPPLTIGVISDTHIYAGGRRALAGQILDLFNRSEVGLILHAGDVNAMGVLAELSQVAPVIAVQGNNDTAEVRDVAPDGLEFEVGRFRFALVHGHGGRSARSEAVRRYGERVDCVIYGHSHIPESSRVGSTVLFNPGSATDRRWQPHFGVGLIHVTANRCQPELILFSDPRELSSIGAQPPVRSAAGLEPAP